MLKWLCKLLAKELTVRRVTKSSGLEGTEPISRSKQVSYERIIQALSSWVLKAAQDGGCTTSLCLCLIIFVVALFPLYHQNDFFFFQLVPPVSHFPVVHHLVSPSVLRGTGELLLGPSQNFLIFFFPNPASQTASVSFQRMYCYALFLHYYYH